MADSVTAPVRALPTLLGRLSRNDGDVSTYIAAAVVLPLLLLLASAGLSLSGLLNAAGEVSTAQSAGIMAAEIQGGVTPAVASLVTSQLGAMGVPGTVSVTGTPGPVTWGGSIELDVVDATTLEGFPWNLMGLAGTTVRLGGPMYATSNLDSQG